MIDPNTNLKVISVQKLQELLKQLPPHIQVSAESELGLFLRGNYIGFIELGSERLVITKK